MIIKIIIADNDKEYIEYFQRAVALNYASKLEISFFSNEENLRKYLIEKKCDILLISEYMEQAEEEFNCRKIILTDIKGIEHKKDYKVIYKYQKIEDIYHSIVAEYAEIKEKEGIVFRNKGNAKIISFLSASGGAGKTTICFAVAKLLCSMKKDVLYVPLEQFSNINYMYPGDETKTLSNLFYATKERKNTLSIQIKNMIRPSMNGMLFLRPMDSPAELEQMTAEDWDFFLNALVDIEGIDYILLDHVSGIFQNFKEILERVNSICFVAESSLTGVVKATSMISYFRKFDEFQDTAFCRKIRVVVNKARLGVTEQDFYHLQDWIVSYLPDYGVAEMEGIIEAMAQLSECRKILELS